MALQKEVKQQILQKFRRAELDTGSPEVQVALLTFQIRKLTEHFKIFKKDEHGRRGLQRKVSQRRKILDYLNARDPKRYEALITELEIRK